MNNNQAQRAELTTSSFCAKTFEANGHLITNTYQCRQARFTAADSWNLLKQKRQFSRTVYIDLN
jgi:hypothetical protein